MTSRALALLAAFASPIFLVAAIAGWLYRVWPANSVTLGIAAFAVASGPLLAIWHVATAREVDDEDDEAYEEAPTAVLRPIPAPILTVQAARAKAFHNWRDSSHPALERRERERRASRYVRS